MTIIKYYKVQASSSEINEGLEDHVKKYLLQQNSARQLLATPVEAFPEALDSNDDAANSLVQDSGEFDILYKKITVKKRKWTLKPSLVGVELVIKANSHDLLNMQTYLNNSNISIIESRKATKAIFEFGKDTPESRDNLVSYFARIKELSNDLFIGANLDFTIYKEKECHYEASFSGQIEPVLNARRFILESELRGSTRKRESVTILP